MTTIDTRSQLAAEIDREIAAHLAERYTDDWELRKLAYHYRREGYVKLSGLVSADLIERVRVETIRLLDAHEKRIDIKLKETGNTPRYMSTLSQAAIAENSELIPAVYESPALKAFLGRLAGDEVLDCPWEGEKYIAIRQHKQGDTHGWHWGDFSFTLIWIIEAPSGEFGGQLQTVPHTVWDKEDPRTTEHLEMLPIRTWPHVTGDTYFLRSDTTLHRTIPLSADRTRIILNTCWASPKDIARAATHETMHAMFD